MLQALRDNEQRVQSLGYNTFRIKFEAVRASWAALSASPARCSRSCCAAPTPTISSWQHAGDALLMTVLGGVHHFLGPLWGAIAFILLEDRLSAITESWWLIFAPIVMVFALASPEGMQGLVFRAARPRRLDADARAASRRGRRRIEPWRGGGDAHLDADRPVLEVRGLHKRFGSLVVAPDVHLDVHPFRLHSLIGPNGAGKTTFFNMLTGLLRADAGEIRFDGHDITHLPVHRRIRLGLSRSFQILSVFRNLTTFENVRVAVQAQSPQQNSLWRDAYRLDDVNARTWSLLAAVGLEDRAAEPCANLSHGEQRLLEIAISLATDAKLLLLDEPLAGLAEADREVVGALIRQLAATPRGAADRARHRPRAGAVGPHHRAAPGPRDRRRQAGRGREQSGRDHRLYGHGTRRRPAADRARRRRRVPPRRSRCWHWNRCAPATPAAWC